MKKEKEIEGRRENETEGKNERVEVNSGEEKKREREGTKE